jgi:dTDP-4-amino-4,6-dideoxygalactose transaminase
MIPFQKPYGLDKALPLVEQVLLSGMTGGDGPMGQQCRSWISGRMPAAEVLMTSSGTAALEAAFRVMGLSPGDEVILPAHAYPADATAVLLAGGTPVFAPSDPLRLMLDPAALPALLTVRTRALLVIHYGGQCADMEPILSFAREHGLLVVEDAAQAFLSRHMGRYAGTMGDFGCFSFHGTKDVVAGEGGALLVNNSRFLEPLRYWRRNGTNRDAFAAGEVDRYEWVALGSSLAPSELSMALLASQLARADTIVTARRRLFRVYAEHFSSRLGRESASSPLMGCARVLPEVEENGHLFWLLLRTGEQAQRLVRSLAARGIDARTHFVPLQESRYGKQYVRIGQTFGVERDLGRRLVRLPLFCGMTDKEQATVTEAVDTWLESEGTPDA